MNKKQYIEKYGKEAHKEKLERDKTWQKEHPKQNKIAHAKYMKTEKGKAAGKRGADKYSKSKKGKAAIRARENTERRKTQKSKQHAEWVKTENGKKLAREGERRYKQTEKGKVVQAKVDARRKDLGFLPLNNPFEDAQAHHINREVVMYIPQELHQSVRHNITTEKGMDEINHLAFEWLGERK